MIENKFKREMTEQERAFFLGTDWRDYGKPFLKATLDYVKERAVQTNDDDKEWFRLQGEARRLKVLLDIDDMIRQTVKEKEKEN